MLVIVLQGIYSLNLVCSYAIMIYPCNMIIEDYLLKGVIQQDARGALRARQTTLKYRLQNLSRALVCFAAIYAAIELKDQLDKFLSLLGALLCAPLAISFPCLLHYVVVAKTKTAKTIDLVLLVFSLIILFFSTYQCISGWYKEEEKAPAGG